MRARKAVITAAGRGTRMFPATRTVQKEMLPLVDVDGIAKPTIQLILDDCLRSGIEQICVVVEKNGAGPFQDHFRPLTAAERDVYASKPWMIEQAGRIAEMAARIHYVEQPSPEGFGHAVYQARSWVGAEPFLLLLGDHVYTGPAAGGPTPIGQILDAGAREDGSITSVLLEPESAVGSTGVVKCRPLDAARGVDAPGQIYEILALKEKPTIEEARALVTPGIADGWYLAHFGLHLFTADIFACLGELIERNLRVKNEFQLTSAQELLLQRSQRGAAPPYRAAFLDGARWDTGKPDVYLETLTALARRGPFLASLR